jgi:DNA-binding transcriptional ArsR family regulator
VAGRDARAELARADLIFDGARRQILLVLHFRGGRMTSGEIADRFSCEWATTTHHLAILERAGLVTVKRKGRSRIYTLDSRLLKRTLSRFTRVFESR